MQESWDETEESFNRWYGEELIEPDPALLPKGSNMMTPEVLGYIERDGIVVEISAGTGMDNVSRLIGVTFCEWGDDGEWLASDRSRCCHSWDEVLAATR